MRGEAKWAAAAALALLAGCEDHQQSNYVDKTEFNSAIEKLEFRLDQIELGPANLTPDEKSFVMVQSQLGPLPISFESIEQYADGSRVMVEIGNSTSATIAEASFNLSWGSGKFAGESDQTGTKRIAEPLLPGRWNRITLDLSGVKPSEFGHLTFFAVDAKQLRMSSP